MVVVTCQQAGIQADPKEPTMSTETTTAHYLVTTARDHTLKVHRSTCKKALANPAAFATDEFETSLGGQTATPATCCKPRPLPVPDAEPAPEAEPVVPAPEPEQVPDVPATAKAKRAGRLEVKVRFVRNGEPMPDSQNKLASVAYYHTKDVEPGADRCTTGRLREILAEAGVAAPEAEPWGPVTLSNGVVLQATAL
jgi:hypothetical protein